MGGIPFLNELALVAMVAVAVTVLLSKVRLPTVTGLLAAGALMGPYGFGLTHSAHAIEVLAEVGVVLLLFTIGLEFSLARLRDIFREVAMGGALQVGLTTLVIGGSAYALGEPPGRSVFYGFAFALSSTAIVLRALSERRELAAPHGRIIVGTLIFQDLCVVPMVLLVPLLAQATGAWGIVTSMGIALGKAAGVVALTVGLSRFAVPKILDWVDASRSREVFLLAILALCIGTAWLTSLAGLSLALGAFLGGMVVADTEYGHRAMGDILPLKDAFVSVFFVSLGMLFDPGTVIAQPLLVGTLLAGFLLAKGLLATLAALAIKFPARVAWLAGVGLAQFGEFGFVLTRLAKDVGLITDEAVSPLLAAGIASMFLTPLLVRIAPHITAGEKLLAPLERMLGVRGIDEADPAIVRLEGHVIVVGFGLAGRLAAEALRDREEPFVVLELSAENVRRGKREGMPVYYADATSEEALRHAHAESARLVVLLINDEQAVARVVDTLRRVAPEVPTLVRSRYLAERAGLLDLGARDIVAEEVEGAVEILVRILRTLQTPRNVIDQSVRTARARTQTSERKATVPRSRIGEVRALDALKIECAQVLSGSPIVGQSPASLRLRSETGALVVGVTRGEQLLENLDPHSPFEIGDVVYFVGTTEALYRALGLFEASSGTLSLRP